MGSRQTEGTAAFTLDKACGANKWLRIDAHYLRHSTSGKRPREASGDLTRNYVRTGGVRKTQMSRTGDHVDSSCGSSTIFLISSISSLPRTERSTCISRIARICRPCLGMTLRSREHTASLRSSVPFSARCLIQLTANFASASTRNASVPH